MGNVSIPFVKKSSRYELLTGPVCLVGMTDILRIYEFEKPFFHHPGNVMNTHRITRAAEHRSNFLNRHEIVLTDNKNRLADEIRRYPFFPFEQGKHRLAEGFITGSKFFMQGGLPIV